MPETGGLDKEGEFEKWLNEKDEKLNRWLKEKFGMNDLAQGFMLGFVTATMAIILLMSNV